MSHNEFKDFKEIPQDAGKPSEIIKLKEAMHLYEPRYRGGTVVNSEIIKWKPIDSVAARVVATAPWYCKVEEKPKFMDPEMISPSIRTKRMLTEEGYVETVLNAADTARAGASAMVKETPKALQASEALVERAREAADTLHVLIGSVKGGWEEYQETMKKAISDARQTRIALEIETRALMLDLREVRSFFLDDKHQDQVQRLERFVNLCHQLKELKDSGFLDAVSDTILNLASSD